MTKPIKRGFTLSFQIRYCLTMIFCFLLSSLAFYFYFDHNLNGSYFQSLSTISQLQEGLPVALGLTFLLQCLVMLALTVVINVYVSHKIAGPVYRYEHSLRALRAGELGHVVRTRDGDQLKNLVAVMNRLFAATRRSLAAAAVVRDELSGMLAGMEQGGAIDDRAVRAAIATARQQLGGTIEEQTDEAR